MKHEEFKKPMLASTYHGIALIALIATPVAGAVVMSEPNSLGTALAIFLMGAFGSVMLFAVGHAIDLLSRTEYNTRELNRKMVHLIRGQLEADDLLKKMAGEDELEEEDVFDFGDLPPRR